MRRAEKQGFQHNPQPYRDISKHQGHGGADDGPTAGNGRKMMPENDELAGRNIINTVIDFHRRGWITAVHIKHSLNKSRMEAIPEIESRR